MGEISYVVPENLLEHTQERSLAARIDTLEDVEDLQQHEYVMENDDNVEGKHRNKQLRQEISVLDNGLRILNDYTRHLQQKNEKLDSDIEKILWAQNKAKLTLPSQQNFQGGISRTMEQHVAQVANAGNEGDISEETCNRRHVLIGNINAMKERLEERKKKIEQNEIHATRLKQENLIMRKRNHARLIRLERQHQEAKFRHQQVLNKLTTLRERLKKYAANIHQVNYATNLH